MNELTQINVILRSIISQTVPNAMQQQSITQPAAVQTIPIGTMLSGNLVGRDPRGGSGFLLRTPKGDMLIKSDQNLAMGSKIDLIIENVGEQIKARILAIDGQALELPETENETNVPSSITTLGEGNEEIEVGSYNKNFKNLALAQQAKLDLVMLAETDSGSPQVEVKLDAPLKQQLQQLKAMLPENLVPLMEKLADGKPVIMKIAPAILPQVAESVGIKVVPLTLDPPDIIEPNQTNAPPGTKPPAEQQLQRPYVNQTFQPVQTLSDQKVRDSLFPDLSSLVEEASHNPQAANAATPNLTSASNILNQQNSTSVSQAQQPKIAMVGNTLVMAAEVAQNAETGELAIQTPIGVLKPSPSNPPLQPGQTFALVIASDNEIHLVSTEQYSSSQKNVSPRFDSLDAVVRMAQHVDQTNQLMNAINQVIPQPNKKMATSMLFIMSAITGGNARKLLGEAFQESIESSSRSDAIKKAIAEISGATQMITDKNDMQWQAYYIPVFDGEKLNELSLYVKRDPDKEKNKGGDDDDSRFVFDVKFSHLGRMQFDGFLKPGKNIDLMVRSEAPIPDYMKSNIYGLFNEAMEVTGFKGSLAFLVSREFAVELAEAPIFKHNDDVIV